MQSVRAYAHACRHVHACTRRRGRGKRLKRAPSSGQSAHTSFAREMLGTRAVAPAHHTCCRAVSATHILERQHSVLPVLRDQRRRLRRRVGAVALALGRDVRRAAPLEPQVEPQVAPVSARRPVGASAARAQPGRRQGAHACQFARRSTQPQARPMPHAPGCGLRTRATRGRRRQGASAQETNAPGRRRQGTRAHAPPPAPRTAAPRSPTPPCAWPPSSWGERGSNAPSISAENNNDEPVHERIY
jgi:hypothetical protein